MYGSVSVPGLGASWWRNLGAFMGLGLIISVGYMDPGNWATDLSGGAQYGYTLLIVILLANFCAMFLQASSHCSTLCSCPQPLMVVDKPVHKLSKSALSWQCMI